MQGAGKTVSEQDVLADILRRDERDSSRAVAPLIAARRTRTMLDTTQLDIERRVQAAIEIVESIGAEPSAAY